MLIRQYSNLTQYRFRNADHKAAGFPTTGSSQNHDRPEISEDDISQIKTFLVRSGVAMTAGLAIGAKLWGAPGAALGALCGVCAVSLYYQRGD